MTDEIIIKKSDIIKLKTEGSKLVVKREAEIALIALLDLKDLIDKTVKEVKEGIAESGQKVLGEGFKGVVGERIRATFRTYGERFETTNSDYTKQVSITRTDNQKIDSYFKDKGKLPPKTKERERVKKLVISRIDESKTKS